MSYFRIKELRQEHISPYNVKEFLFKMIQDEFGFGYIPEYHQDIKNIRSFYINPARNTFFLAIDHESGKVIGTIGIRAYDRDYLVFKDFYNSQTTASLWRVFVDKPWRRNGVASTLVHTAEDFCRKKGYKKVYLHTHKTVPGSLDFWISNGYHVTDDTSNHLKTVHMEKKLDNVTPICDSYGVLIFQG